MDKKAQNEYQIEIKVKNNLILKKLEERGYKTVGAFCRTNNKMTWCSPIGNLVNLKDSPLNSKGDFHSFVLEMCVILKCCPEELFTETQLHTAMASNKRTLQVNEAEMLFMIQHHKEPQSLEKYYDNLRLPETIDNIIANLPLREQKVLKLRFGLQGWTEHTLEEIAAIEGVNRERISQIEAKALHRLRKLKRSIIHE